MTDTAARDAHGRYRPGASGNPHGRPPGRTHWAVHALVDEALAAVLTHDLRLIRDQSTYPPRRNDALDRLARLCARRIAPAPSEPVEDAADQLVAIIARHVPDPCVRNAIARDFEALYSPDGGENDDTDAPPP